MNQTTKQTATNATDKTKQADYYDHDVADPEFEINRPHGESRLYRYLMDFKFSSVESHLSRPLRGSKVLVICCGSGMDAEYVVRAGASVVAMDISDGCLDRARLRANRYGLKYDLVRGDAENLPFGDGTFDYGFVHDGLHHLPEPDRAIAELARIARRGIMVTEPADAAVTNMLIRLGVMQPYEEAGNFVIRLCRSLGFDRMKSSRYLVKYGHPPASWWHRFDSALPFLAARAGFSLFGVSLFGRWGNKLAFVAERTGPAGGAAV
jgi:ubiquinone/menaquinone biosynthesis C-methylase UbiE